MMLFKDLISRNPSLKLKLNNFENKLLLKNANYVNIIEKKTILSLHNIYYV